MNFVAKLMTGILLVILHQNFISTPAYAEGDGGGGNEGGHGGIGVVVNEKVGSSGKVSTWLLDLIDSGLEKNPYIETDIAPSPQVTRIVNEAMNGLCVSKTCEVPLDLLAKKITEIAKFDAVLAMSILRAIQMHVWYDVGRELWNTGDGAQTDTKILEKDQVQLARRQGAEIKINREAWNDLGVIYADDQGSRWRSWEDNGANRVALIIHEAVYSLIRASNKALEKEFQKTDFPELNLNALARRARQITAYLFRPGYMTRDRAAFDRITVGVIPTAKSTWSCDSEGGACIRDGKVLPHMGFSVELGRVRFDMNVPYRVDLRGTISSRAADEAKVEEYLNGLKGFLKSQLDNPEAWTSGTIDSDVDGGTTKIDHSGFFKGAEQLGVSLYYFDLALQRFSQCPAISYDFQNLTLNAESTGSKDEVNAAKGGTCIAWANQSSSSAIQDRFAKAQYQYLTFHRDRIDADIDAARRQIHEALDISNSVLK